MPETVGRLVKEGFEVLVETGAGRDYNLDENYEEAGATIVEDAGKVYGEADLVVKVASPTEEEVGLMQEGQILVCFLNGQQPPGLVKKLADAGVTGYSNEASPRTSVSAGGFTSLMRPTCDVVSGPWPTGTIEIVPSVAIRSDVCGGTLIGPPSPITC